MAKICKWNLIGITTVIENQSRVKVMGNYSLTFAKICICSFDKFMTVLRMIMTTRSGNGIDSIH